MTLLLPLLAWAGSPETGTRPVTLAFGLSHSSFSDVNRNDAEAAFKTFADTAARKRGYQLTFTAQVFDDVPSYQAAVRSHAVNVAVIDSWDYLGADLADHLEIGFIKERTGIVGEAYVLLTRRDSGLNSVADLRGKELALLESSNAKLSRRWLEFLVLTNGRGDPANFYGKVEVVRKPTAAALPVFFGKRASCIITRAAYDVMIQLNPQLERELQIIAASPYFVESVLCLASRGWEPEEFKRDLSEGVLEMGSEPSGQQILNLFKADRFVAYRPEHLQSVREFRADYDRLKGKKAL